MMLRNQSLISLPFIGLTIERANFPRPPTHQLITPGMHATDNQRPGGNVRCKYRPGVFPLPSQTYSKEFK